MRPSSRNHSSLLPIKETKLKLEAKLVKLALELDCNCYNIHSILEPIVYLTAFKLHINSALLIVIIHI